MGILTSIFTVPMMLIILVLAIFFFGGSDFIFANPVIIIFALLVWVMTRGKK